VCELAIHWEKKYLDVPSQFIYAITLLGAKGANAIVLDIQTSGIWHETDAWIPNLSPPTTF
jgi:hypothetical protein